MKNELYGTLSTKNILVTGAAGLIGSTLIDRLVEIAQDYNTNMIIFALGRNINKLEERFAEHISSGVVLRLIEGDVTNNLPEVQADYIVHAASPAHPLAYSQTPVDVMKANLIGTINMLELAKRNRSRLLFVSSGEIYGTSDVPDSAFQESDYGYIEILNPRSCYPESKRAAETLCAGYHIQYGVDTVIARLCHVYGPSIIDNNSRADAQFLRNALRNEDIVMKSPGTQTRSFCYVKDAVAGILHILVMGASGEAYNVANKNSVATIREYAETLASISGVRIKNEYPSEQEAKGYSQISRAVLDASKLERLGWEPRYDLRQGLSDTYNCLREKMT